MLRKTRIFVVIFFIISVLLFGGYTLIRAVTVDRTLPIIEMDSDEVTISVKGGDTAILEGIKASDEKDGDITGNLFVESKSTFIEKGIFKATIAVADSDNHVTKVERKVTYSDYRSPQFTLTEPLKFLTTRENRDDLNIAESLRANDVVDGNISNKIKISSEYSINGYTPGDSHMEFIVTNSMGDTSKLPVTVNIYSALEESGLPEIILSNYLINTPVGAGADIEALIEQIEYHNDTFRRGEDGNLYNGEFDAEGNPIMFDWSAIQIDTDADWNTPGVYEVKITFTDEAANLSNFTRCYVVVY
jgi:hypothetical protein